MRKLQILILFTIFINFLSAQDSCTSKEYALKTAEYTISYSSNFRLDTNKIAGIEFVLATANEGENDVFIENINLVRQDLSGLKTDMESIIKTNRTEIENFARIIESEKLNDYNSYKLLYSCSHNGVKLIIAQRFILINNLLYILTFSGEYDKYYKSEEEIKRIMKSFCFASVDLESLCLKNNKTI